MIHGLCFQVNARCARPWHLPKRNRLDVWSAPDIRKLFMHGRLAALFCLVCVPTARTGEPIYPVKVSESGRYFTDQKREPLFWLGTTQWQLVRDYTLTEARAILQRTRKNGFVFAQVMLLGVGDGTKPNVQGEKPWTDDNPLTPNEAYFKNVDAVLGIAAQNSVVISMTIYHQINRKYLTADNARAWAPQPASESVVGSCVKCGLDTR
jgi:Protein of unknown function (DUF4038)